jgi:hypothetical protein
MHPNAFLRTFWRTDLRPQVFVAMSFGETYDRRYIDVIEPAIRAVTVGGVSLEPYRVDNSKTGDSILTDILDGIAHSQLVLADVSSLGYDSKSADPYRNGNVMYEVGLAVACRQPMEVLLIRDDKHKFLFDVSTIPHKYVDFTDVPKARAEIASELAARLNERHFFADARLRLAAASLTAEERKVIEAFSKYKPGEAFWTEQQNFVTIAALPRLVDKQLLRAVGRTADGKVAYTWTPLGHHVLEVIERDLPLVAPQPSPDATSSLDRQDSQGALPEAAT